MNAALIQRAIFNSEVTSTPIFGTTAFIIRARQRVYVLPAHPRAQP